MYAAKPRSLYRKFPGALTAQPPSDAPYSGNLIFSDEESDTMDFSCFGICNNDRIKTLPFPQDRMLRVVHSSSHEEASVTKVWFVPVLDHSLSLNRYYVLKAKGRHKGQAYTCSREGEETLCCFKNLGTDSKTRPLDYRNRYQQFEIHHNHGGGFFAQSLEWDGYPPDFLRKNGWEVYVSRSFKLHLQETRDHLHSFTSSNLPELNFPLYSKRSTTTVIGSWYTPFAFVREDEGNNNMISIGDQMRKSLIYEWSLKQWWEEIYSCENGSNQGRNNNLVSMDVRVKRSFCLVRGMEAEEDDDRRQEFEGFQWFRVGERSGLRRAGVGLSLGVYEKLRGLQERRGWFDNDGEKEIRVHGRKEIESGREWRRFGCYVFVESFELRGMDGGLLINFSFRDTHRVQCKWE
ncbi:uncharacterized protein [Primulina eburnea]|uniref:uncharacterized protein n=1 Tax=Primulina eburnea TaxID=1245227 RepID=UPI003C6C5BF5